jgi:dihydrolipoamide dehydrogenase
VKLPSFPWDDPRVMDSTDALKLADVPKKLLVVGGGIIGLEMATVYRALGSEVTVVEFMDQLMPGADKDLVKPLADRLKKQGVAVHLKTKVVEVQGGQEGHHRALREATEGIRSRGHAYDRVLVAVGRAPNGGKLDADKAGVAVTDRGFIPVDRQMRTNVPHIFAIGDLVGQPMLAHKATHEGKLAAEVAAGEKKEWVARVIPSRGLHRSGNRLGRRHRDRSQGQGPEGRRGQVPVGGVGRAIGIGAPRASPSWSSTRPPTASSARHRRRACRRPDRRTRAGHRDGREVADIGHTIHPHPTLSESVGMAAEVYDGTITDLYIPKRGGVAGAGTALGRLLLGTALKWLVVAAGLYLAMAVWRLPAVPALAGAAMAAAAFVVSMKYAAARPSTTRAST